MKIKSLVSIILIFSIPICLLLAISKNSSSQEVTLDDVNIFVKSFKWKDISTRRLAIHAIEIVPKDHKAIAMEKLSAALERNVLTAADGMVSREIFFTSLKEVVPPKILPFVLKILSKVK